jgi:hypothetical protein
MADDWQSVFESLPANNEVVWVRVLNYYGEPVLAQYKSFQDEFTSVTTSVDFPVFYVARWKSQ